MELTGLTSAGLGRDPTIFPAGWNVEFPWGTPVDDADGHVLSGPRARLGETLSGGTGACAVAAVAMRDAGRATG